MPSSEIRYTPRSAAFANTPPLSLEKAFDIFHELATLPNMAWGYRNTICALKAYLACEICLDNNLVPFKAWAFQNKTPLYVLDPERGEWWYHVALALPVLMPKGDVQPLVFDPTFFGMPVSLQEWGTTLGATSDKRLVLDHNQPPDGSITGRPDEQIYPSHTPRQTAIAWRELRHYQLWQPPIVRLVFESTEIVDPSPKERSRIGWDFISESPAAPGPWVPPQRQQPPQHP